MNKRGDVVSLYPVYALFGTHVSVYDRSRIGILVKWVMKRGGVCLFGSVGRGFGKNGNNNNNNNNNNNFYYYNYLFVARLVGPKLSGVEQRTRLFSSTKEYPCPPVRAPRCDDGGEEGTKRKSKE